MYGYTVDEFLKLNVIDLVDPEFLPQVKQKMREKIDGKADTTTYEILTYSKTGEKIWIESSTRLIKFDNQVKGIQGIARNITDRKLSEDKLKQSEQKFRGVFETIDDIYYHLNADNTFDLVSPSCYTHLGYQSDELLGTHIESLYAKPEERADVYKKLLEDGRILDYEINLLHKSGSITPFSVSARVLFDKNGDPEGIEGIARNISQRKMHERIQMTNEQRFRRIFESIQDLYYRIEDGVIKFVSPSCKTLLGYSPEEMIGHRAEEFYCDPSARLSMLNEFFKTGFLNDYEIDYAHKDGHPVTCSININGVKK